MSRRCNAILFLPLKWHFTAAPISAAAYEYAGYLGVHNRAVVMPFEK